jgi:DNA-binding response OmpR family regulator
MILFLVDDDPDTCMRHQMVLQAAGYECNSFTDPVKSTERI